MRTLLHSNGMTGVRDSERIMSLNVDRKVVWDYYPQRMTIGWVRFDSFPSYRINAMYVSVLRDNDPAPTACSVYERRTCWVNNLKFKTPSNKKEIWIEGR